MSAYGQGGFSYVEVLVAAALLALLLLPAADALRNGLEAGRLASSRAVLHHHVLGRLEEVLAEPFDRLDAEALAAGGPGTLTAYSDALGATDRRLVYLARYDGDDADADGDPFTGVDADLLWVRVELEGGSVGLQTLTVR